MAFTVQLSDGTPAFVAEWLVQLTHPDTLAALRASASARVDVTLYAHRGKAVKGPEIVARTTPFPSRTS